MNEFSMRSVTLKSAITPSFNGRMATMLPGVRPSISLASRPTASISPFSLLMATMDGSLTMTPLPFAYTSVLAVPRSMARSEEKTLKSERRLIPFKNPFLIPKAGPRLSLFDHNRFANGFGITCPVLGCNSDLVRTFSGKRRSKVPEGTVRRNIKHLLIINDDRGARFRAAHHFNDPPVLDDVRDLKEGLMVFRNLLHKVEAVGRRWLAFIPAGINRLHKPIINSLVKAGNLCRSALDPPVHNKI